jgi:hypothetical protein
MLIMEGVLLLLVNVNLLHPFWWGSKLLLLLSLLNIFKICRLWYAVNSLICLLLPLATHTHVHFLSRLRSLLLRYEISNHSSLIEISLLFPAWLRNGWLVTLPNELLLLLLSWIYLPSTAHRIDRLRKRLPVRLSLLFVCSICLVCGHTSEVLSGHGLREITITVVIFVIIKTLIIIILIVYVFCDFMSIIINKGIDRGLSYIRWFVCSVIERNLDLIKVSLIELLLSIQIS